MNKIDKAIEELIVKFLDHYEQHRETYKKWKPEDIAKTFAKHPSKIQSLLSEKDKELEHLRAVKETYARQLKQQTKENGVSISRIKQLEEGIRLFVLAARKGYIQVFCDLYNPIKNLEKALHREPTSEKEFDKKTDQEKNDWLKKQDISTKPELYTLQEVGDKALDFAKWIGGDDDLKWYKDLWQQYKQQLEKK